MFLARVLFFRLSESPRFLAASGDYAGALESLEKISKFNGNEKEWSLNDVIDDNGNFGRATLGDERGGERGALGGDGLDYDSTAESDSPLSGRGSPTGYSSPPSHLLLSPGSTTRSRATKNREDGIRYIDQYLPTGIASFIDDNLERTTVLFEPRYRLSTQLIWTIWTLVSAAYSIFNVFLPKFLEAKVGASGGSRTESLQDCENSILSHLFFCFHSYEVRVADINSRSHLYPGWYAW